MITWTEEKTIAFSETINQLKESLQAIADAAGNNASQWIENFDKATDCAHPITKKCLQNLKKIAEFIAEQPLRTKASLSELSGALKISSESNFKGLLKGKRIEELAPHHTLLLRNLEKDVLNQISIIVQNSAKETSENIRKVKNRGRNADLEKGFQMATNVTLSAGAVLTGLKGLYLLYEAAEMTRSLLKERTPYNQIVAATKSLDFQSELLSDLLKICIVLHRIPNSDDVEKNIDVVEEKEAEKRLRMLMPNDIRSTI